MPLSDANLSQAAHVFKRIFNGRYQCLHCEIHVPFRYECFNHLELYSKSVTKVLQGTHNSWETLPLHIRPFPRGSRERSSVNALNCKSMPGLPCAHCILPLTNQTGKKTIPCRTRIDSSPYAHLSPSWQMENCPLMRRLTGRPDRMITVKKGQKKQTTKTINESTCERRSACYLVIMILMSFSILLWCLLSSLHLTVMSSRSMFPLSFTASKRSKVAPKSQVLGIAPKSQHVSKNKLHLLFQEQIF